MKLPRAKRSTARPRLQIDIDECVSRAVCMAAAKKGQSQSAWVMDKIIPYLTKEIAEAKQAIAEENDTASAKECNAASKDILS